VTELDVATGVELLSAKSRNS